MVQRKGALDLESEDLSATLALTSGYTPECQPLTCWSPHLRHVSAACPTQPDSVGCGENAKETVLWNLSSLKQIHLYLR